MFLTKKKFSATQSEVLNQFLGDDHSFVDAGTVLGFNQSRPQIRADVVRALIRRMESNVVIGSESTRFELQPTRERTEGFIQNPIWSYSRIGNTLRWPLN